MVISQQRQEDLSSDLPALVAHSRGSALVALTQVEAGLAAGVRSNVGGAAVGLPDVHLGAAGTVALDVSLDIPRA